MRVLAITLLVAAVYLLNEIGMLTVLNKQRLEEIDVLRQAIEAIEPLVWDYRVTIIK